MKMTGRVEFELICTDNDQLSPEVTLRSALHEAEELLVERIASIESGVVSLSEVRKEFSRELPNDCI